MIKVKICGLTNLVDARFAAEAGADYLGFIFYKPSPRYVVPEIVKEIVVTLDTLNPKPVCVGVFVNEDAANVSEIFNFCRLDAVQLHGDEPPEFVSRFAGRAYKVLRPQSRDDAETLVNNYAGLNQSLAIRDSQLPNLPDFLLEAYHPNLYGGTGHVTDWGMAAQIARQHGIMLAGSLTPANVAPAIKAVRPWAVDVSSGVELKKGRKDYGKVQAFIKAVKGV